MKFNIKITVFFFFLFFWFRGQLNWFHSDRPKMSWFSWTHTLIFSVIIMDCLQTSFYILQKERVRKSNYSYFYKQFCIVENTWILCVCHKQQDWSSFFKQVMHGGLVAYYGFMHVRDYVVSLWGNLEFHATRVYSTGELFKKIILQPWIWGCL